MGRSSKIASADNTNTNANSNSGFKFQAPDLGTIRANFDGLQKQVNSLPEGKAKKNLTNMIEDVYLWTAQAFRGFVDSSTTA